MGISIGSNSMSVQAQAELNKTTNSLSTVYQRLASGLRINKSSDDPAGLAFADSLKSQATIASAAIRNANDGLSITAVVDAGLDEIDNILNRMAELATQSANAVYTDSQRSALASEFIALGSEIERIATTTSFNNISLLSNSSNLTLQVGFTAASTSQITMQGVNGTLAALGLARNGSSALTFSVSHTLGGTASQSAAQNALTAVNAAIGSLSVARGTIGAVESRLSFAINHLSATRENLLSAESRIRDADIAEESANLVRLQILQQAGTAVLAQANQQPARALDLLT